MNKYIAHILVVDDDDGIRSLVKQYLNEHNYLITTASSAEEANEKVLLISRIFSSKSKTMLDLSSLRGKPLNETMGFFKIDPLIQIDVGNSSSKDLKELTCLNIVVCHIFSII